MEILEFDVYLFISDDTQQNSMIHEKSPMCHINKIIKTSADETIYNWFKMNEDSQWAKGIIKGSLNVWISCENTDSMSRPDRWCYAIYSCSNIVIGFLTTV